MRPPTDQGRQAARHTPNLQVYPYPNARHPRMARKRRHDPKAGETRSQVKFPSVKKRPLPTSKVCKQCGGDPKPLNQFYDAPANADGKAGKCMDCMKKAEKARQQIKRAARLTPAQRVGWQICSPRNTNHRSPNLSARS